LVFQGLDSFHKDWDIQVFLGLDWDGLSVLVFLEYWINDSTKIKAMNTALVVASVKRGKTEAGKSIIFDEAKTSK